MSVSPFPRHWIYDEACVLVASGVDRRGASTTRIGGAAHWLAVGGTCRLGSGRPGDGTMDVASTTTSATEVSTEAATTGTISWRPLLAWTARTVAVSDPIEIELNKEKGMSKKRLITAVATVLLTLALTAGPAVAHNQVIDPPGNGDTKENWVGGPILPATAQGKGLMDGPPFLPGSKQPASHGKGLNTACLQLEDNPSVVDIRGPAGPGGTGCAHGGFDPQ